MSPAHASHTGLSRAEQLIVRGDDMRPFAAAQLSSRIDRLATDRWHWTAWLDATGKVRMLGMAWLQGDAIHVLLRGGVASALAGAMRRYVMRARVTLESRSDAVLEPGDALPAGALECDAEALIFGLGPYSLRMRQQSAPIQGGAHAELARQAIDNGHPWLPDAALDSLLPPALNLYQLGAVALGKGCYPGQEMANRLYTHGGHKYALAHLRMTDLPQAGQPLESHDRKLGQVLVADARDALAVLHRDAAHLAPGLVVAHWFN